MIAQIAYHPAHLKWGHSDPHVDHPDIELSETISIEHPQPRRICEFVIGWVVIVHFHPVIKGAF